MADQCSATSKTTGSQCRKPAIPGGTVCRNHGGNAPQVRRKAEERLAALVDPAIGALSRMIQQKRKIDAVTMAAVRDILDRAGPLRSERVEVNGDIVDRLAAARKRSGDQNKPG